MIPAIPQIIAERGEVLEQAGIEAGRVEVELILCYVLELDRLHLYLQGRDLLSEERLKRVDEIVERRATRYPLQYILGEWWFFGRRFVVNEAVMVPTPETELLCDRAIRFAHYRRMESPHVLDLGTGSGVIAITVACELPAASVLATDLSADALSVARQNSEMHGVLERVVFRQADLFAAVDDNERFDLVLSNPPYICESEWEALPPEVRADPKLAITSGRDGMDAIRSIVEQAPSFLRPDGRIMFEIGYDQAEQVADLTAGDDRYRSIDILRDLNDIDRVVILSCNRQQ